METVVVYSCIDENQCPKNNQQDLVIKLGGSKKINSEKL
jgi:hypothetical protein